KTSHAFLLPAVLLVDGEGLAKRANAWAEHLRAVLADLAEIDREIDARCFDLYGIAASDRRAINEGFAGGAEASGENNDGDTDAEDDEHEEASGSDTGTLAADLVSWAVGVAFGRFDLRLATRARPLPKEPEPFALLPLCSPSMLTGDNGLPLLRAPADYPVTFPDNG